MKLKSLCRLVRHDFHEKAVNNNLKFTSTFFYKRLGFNSIEILPPASPGGREGRSPRRGFGGDKRGRAGVRSAGFGAAAPDPCGRAAGRWLRNETGSRASIRTRLAGSVDLTWCMILILVSCLKGVERRYLVPAIRRCDGCRRGAAVVPDLRNCFIVFMASRVSGGV